MHVVELRLTDFRNFRTLEFQPGTGLNILHGDNAQGKTNILEALSVLATTRSLRASRESELIHRDREVAHVTAEVDREREGDAELRVSIFPGDKKAVHINAVRRPRVLDLLGHFNAVFFGTIDLPIVTGEPSERRHYLNVEISQISPRYVYDLGHYKRALSQRNRLLRDLRERPRNPEEAGLSVWNEQLVTFGAPLFEKRQFYVERLAPLADEIHQELTDGRESLEIRYLPSIPLSRPSVESPTTVQETSREEGYLAEARREAAGAAGEKDAGSAATCVPVPVSADSVATSFREQLRQVAAEEARRGGTLVGPQRDDLSFRINGAEARIYGSQGQQRTAALSLKLAEFRLIEQSVGEPPVMLLDDVMSDLDEMRRRHLLAWIRRRCQTFLTCTHLHSFPEEILKDARIFRVAAGTVTPDETRAASIG